MADLTQFGSMFASRQEAADNPIPAADPKRSEAAQRRIEELFADEITAFGHTF